MTAPRLEIDLDKIYHNARTLVTLMARVGISITGVTKAVLGSPEIARILLRAGVSGLGDSHIENIEGMRRARVPAAMILIRPPMPSQVSWVVRHADISFNTELEVIAQLSSAAHKMKRTHGIILTVELGDLREGIMPADLEDIVQAVLCFPNIVLRGIGANLACLNGVSPDPGKMAELSMLANSIDAMFGPVLDIVSGGNSANLEWALSGAGVGRINNLRLGEAILLGREALHRQPIEGLHLDAIELVAEVIESKVKPSAPRGEIAQNALGHMSSTPDCGDITRTILAIGRQDTDPQGLIPPPGIEILGASSDHLILNTGNRLLSAGAEITFQVNYSALLRTMMSPFVELVLQSQGDSKYMRA